MKLDFFTLDKINSYPLINGVITKVLKVNRDNRGVLLETLKKNWQDVYDPKSMPFAQNYFSITKPNVARDEDRWHVHPTKQIDRFVVIKGDIIVALFDGRKKSSTYKQLNLFKMGESNGDKGQYMLLIPKKVFHCFLTLPKKEAIIMNFPSALYDPKEEGRVAFNKVQLKDGNYFSWDFVRKELNSNGQ